MNSQAAATADIGGSDDRLQVTSDGDRLVIVCSGRWVLEHVAELDDTLQPLHKRDVISGHTAAVIDLGPLEALDTAGAWLVERTRRRLADHGIEAAVVDAAPANAQLLRQVADTRQDVEVETRPPNKALELVAHVGWATVEFGKEAALLLSFFGMLVVKTLRLVVQPRRLRVTPLVYHMEQSGLNAMPIVGLLSFLIGVVLAYQGADQLQQFGAELLTVNLLGISILRELGVLMTAIIIAGRSGSAFTAQIGTMKVNQEVDAMQTLGLDPVDILVLPRVLALAVTLPLLAFYASMVALLGGAVMAYFTLNITFGQFLMQFQSAVAIEHFWIGMVKAPVFAFVIAMVGCYEGLKVTGSAESVGRLTTQAVVEAIFLVIVIDALFSILFANVGL